MVMVAMRVWVLMMLVHFAIIRSAGFLSVLLRTGLDIL
jgi:hypothetical protein